MKQRYAKTLKPTESIIYYCMHQFISNWTVLQIMSGDLGVSYRSYSE